MKWICVVQHLQFSAQNQASLEMDEIIWFQSTINEESEKKNPKRIKHRCTSRSIL